MKVTISGTPGSGKTTIARMLAKKLGLKHYSAGNIRRKMAIERGLTINELNKLGEKEDFTDREVDEYQQKLGKEDNIMVDGRLSFHFIPDSVKIFLKTDIEEGAKRILGHKRKEEGYSDVEDVENALRERMESDKKRYKKYYNINCYDEGHYDYVLDTTDLTIREVLQKLLKFIKQFRG